MIPFQEKSPEITGQLIKYPDFKSEYIQARNVDVWLPDNYDPNSEDGYSVLYMHDGQNLFDPAPSNIGEEWGVDETMSRLMDEGRIQDCIVVGIWCTEDRMEEYTPNKPYQRMLENKKSMDKEYIPPEGTPGGDSYLIFIVKELKPFIDDNYNTIPDREHTFIAGSSMGGLISLYALVEYPEVFSGAACLSTHWPLDIQEITPDFVNAYAGYLDKNLYPENRQKVYFDYGTETLDQYYEPLQMVIDSLMQAKGFDESSWKTLKFEGAVHNEVSWRERFDIPVLFLLGQK